MRTPTLAHGTAGLAVIALAGCGSHDARTTAVADVAASGLRAVMDPAAVAVAAPGSGARLVLTARGGAAGNAASSTRIAVIGRDGRTRAARVLPGAWSLPAAVPGSSEGISWDGSRVVLVAAGEPGRFISLTAAARLSNARVIEPRGRFRYDGLSADGATLFLTQFASVGAAPTYRIMRYDLATGRLDPEPIVVKGEEGEPMVGDPVARASTADFIYTVYERRTRPFIHALESRGRYSLCLDLPVNGRPGAAAIWSARRLDSGVALVWNGATHRAYRLAGGRLSPISYADAVK